MKDLENLEEITAQEIELLGEDIEDLFEEEQKNEIDDQDSVNDDIEELQGNIEKSRFDINELISDFLEEKTEYKPNQNTELNFLSISFLKWLYYNYPSAPQFNAALIRDVFKEILGKDRFFIGVKTLVSKSARMNASLSQKIADAEGQIADMERKIKTVSINKLKEAIKGKEVPNFFEYAYSRCEKMKGSVSFGTYKNYKLYTKKFETYIGTTDVYFDDITVSVLKAYIS